MRITSTLALLIALTFASPAAAATPYNPSSWAIGLMVGDPTAFSLKHWTGGTNAFDIGIGTGPGVRVHADYLFGLSRLARERSMNLDLYLGIGGVLGVARGHCGWVRHHDHWCHDDGDLFAGVRVPFGLDFILRQAPLEFGLEVAPGMWLGPRDLDPMLDAALFVRFLLR